MSRFGESTWSGADDAILACLWEEGLSTREIGERMGRTKNAVIGRSHRIGCSPRPSPLKGRKSGVFKGAAAIVKAFERQKDRAIPPKPVEKLQPLPSAEVIELVRPPPVHPPRLVARETLPMSRLPHCQYPMWGAKTPPKERKFCDSPIERGSYCADHARVCYVTIRTIRDPWESNRSERIIREIAI